MAKSGYVVSTVEVNLFSSDSNLSGAPINSVSVQYSLSQLPYAQISTIPGKGETMVMDVPYQAARDITSNIQDTQLTGGDINASVMINSTDVYGGGGGKTVVFKGLVKTGGPTLMVGQTSFAASISHPMISLNSLSIGILLNTLNRASFLAGHNEISGSVDYDAHAFMEKILDSGGDPGEDYNVATWVLAVVKGILKTADEFGPDDSISGEILKIQFNETKDLLEKLMPQMQSLLGNQPKAALSEHRIKDLERYVDRQAFFHFILDGISRSNFLDSLTTFLLPSVFMQLVADEDRMIIQPVDFLKAPAGKIDNYESVSWVSGGYMFQQALRQVLMFTPSMSRLSFLPNQDEQPSDLRSSGRFPPQPLPILGSVRTVPVPDWLDIRLIPEKGQEEVHASTYRKRETLDFKKGPKKTGLSKGPVQDTAKQLKDKMRTYLKGMTDFMNDICRAYFTSQILSTTSATVKTAFNEDYKLGENYEIVSPDNNTSLYIGQLVDKTHHIEVQGDTGTAYTMLTFNNIQISDSIKSLLS